MGKYSIEKISFVLILATVLFPTVVLEYIVTGDGPTHLYTSKILVDWHFNHDTAFYKQYLTLNPRFSPNWMTNILQMLLLKMMPINWAEKAFFALYLLTFSFGFRKLIKEINPNSIFLSSIGLLFGWSHILLKGFTNNAWSLAIWFWILAVWIESPKTKFFRYLKLMILFFLCYLSHPIGLMLSLISITVLTFFEGISFRKKLVGFELLTFYWKKMLELTLVSLPALLLFARFFMERSWHKDTEVINRIFVLVDVLRLNAILIFSSHERDIVTGISIAILLLFFWMIYKRLKEKTKIKKDYFFALFVAMLLVTFFPPTGISNGLVIGVRFGMLPHLGLLMWLAVNEFPAWMKKVVPLLVLGFSLALLMVRMPVFQDASDLAEEVIGCKEYIDDQSTLLVLNNDWEGHNADGTKIADRAWLFNHIDCYLGVYKQLFISDYYEGNQNFFPLMTNESANMYFHTSIDGVNFDNRPPRADILGFKKRSGGHDIDYVLLLGYNDIQEHHLYSKEIFNQLEKAYLEVYRSENERAILYQLIR